MRLFLYLLTQEENNGYDYTDSCVVSAESEKDAKEISMANISIGWATSIENINAKAIGISSVEKGIVIISFNAG